MTLNSTMINAFDPAHLPELPATEREMIMRRERLLGPAYRLFYDAPLQLVRGSGVWLYDAEGTAYLDAYNNVPSVGHCHPHVVAAIARQAALLNTHTRYLHPAVLDYSERLLASFPSALSQVMYTCSGSEANDLAIRVATHHTGGSGFIVTRQAYHGVTATVAGLSPSLGEHTPLGPHVRAVPAPAGVAAQGASVGECFAMGVTRALADMRREGIRPAGLIVDTIFSSDGVFADPAGFLQPAVAAVRAAGGLFIADEVQAGFGRLGDTMWGFQRHNLTPDLVTMGKPMGNGYPVAAMVTRPEILSSFGHQARYFNTFGGTPVAMAAAGAVLDVIADERLQDNARMTGQYLREQLIELSQRYEAVAQVRGAGLFLGVELVTDRTTGAPATQLTSRLVNEMRRRRVLISASGPAANVLKIRPPLPIRRQEADLLVSVLDAALKTVSSAAPERTP